MEKVLYIVKNSNFVNPYSVYIGCGYFKQQISPAYFRRGNAVRFLKKYLSVYSENPHLESWVYNSIDNNKKDVLVYVKFIERNK